MLDLVALGGRVDEGALIAACADPAVASGIADARAAGVIERFNGSLRVTHPLLGAVAAARLDSRARRSAHAVLAAATVDPIERARHSALAAERPSASVAASLDEAARLATERGMARVAVELARLAVDMTPSGDAGALMARLVLAASARFGAGDLEGAREAAEVALAMGPRPGDRVALLLLLAEIAVSRGDRTAAQHLARDAATAAGADQVATARVHLAMAQWADDDVATEAGHARDALVALEGHERDAPELVARALSASAYCRFLAGEGLDDPAMRRAVELTGGSRRLAVFDDPIDAYAQLLGCVGRVDEARSWLGALVESVDRVGFEPARPILLARACMLDLADGRLRDASARADEALEAADELDLSFDALRSYRLLVDALTGHEITAAASASAAHAAAIERGDEWSAALFARAGGVAALVADADADAARLLGETVRIGRRFGVHEPSWFRVHGDLVEALVRVGDLDGATELNALLDASASRTGIVWTRLMGARGRALVSGAVGDLAAALAAAGEAREHAVALGSPYEQARTDLVAGVLERRMRRKRAARDLLASAADTFERIGAPTWAGRARAELGRVGARVGAPDQLSESERRVAELAAAGRTNREIADALFLSVRTVESHLGVTYRKLGVRSRTELARALDSTG